MLDYITVTLLILMIQNYRQYVYGSTDPIKVTNISFWAGYAISVLSLERREFEFHFSRHYSKLRHGKLVYEDRCILL